MKNKYRNLMIFCSIILTIFISYRAITNTGGPSGGLTNAPGEGNCTQCHSGSLITSGSNWDNFSLATNIPSTGYIPDSVYTFTISHTQSGINKFGFQTTVLQASNNTKAGSLSVTSSSTTQYKTVGSKDYIMHTSGGVSGSGSISWSFRWQAPSTDVGDIRAYSTLNATNSGNNTSGDQIYAKTWTFSVSTLLPTAIITPSATTICVDDTLFLSGSGANNPTTWEWTMSGGTPSSANTQNAFAVYTSSGSKQISLVTYNSKGKSKTATININVVAKPSASISITGKTSFCPGDSVILSAPTGSGLTYLWNSNETSRSITVKDSGDYFVTVTNSSGCKAASQTITTKIFTKPMVSMVSSALNDSLCKGDTVVLTANTGLTGYAFYDKMNLLQSGTSNTYSTQSLSNGNDLYVVGINSDGCSDTSNHISLTVVEPDAGPVVSCGNKTTNSVEFTWQDMPQATGYLLSIDSGKNWISPSSGNKGLLHEVSGLDYSQNVSLWIKAIDNSLCMFSDISKHFCTTLSCSGIEFIVNYDSAVCKGDSIHFTISNISVPNYSINFNNTGYSKDTMYFLIADTTTIYVMDIIDSNALNCPPIHMYLPVDVEMSEKPILSSLPSDFAVCEGEELTVFALTGSAFYSFLINDVVMEDHVTTNMFSNSSYKDGDKASVITESLRGCINTSDDELITVYEIKEISLGSNHESNDFCKMDEIELLASEGFLLYRFYDNEGMLLQSSVDSIYTSPAEKDMYGFYVIATDANSCVSRSDTLMLNVYPLPLVGFTFSANGLQYTFNDTTSNAVKWLWDFGDMSSDSVKNPIHNYASQGLYDVILFTTNDKGCSDSSSARIDAQPNLITDYIYDKSAYFLYYPSKSEVYIHFQSDKGESVYASSMNISTGKIVHELSEYHAAGKNKMIIPVSDWGKGLYVIRFISDGKVFNHKIFIP